MKQKSIITVFILLFLSFGLFAGDLAVLYKCNKTNLAVESVDLFIQIVNSSNSSIALQDLEVRYFYTKEGTSTEICEVYFAQIGSSNVIVSCKAGYISLTFTQGAGKIPAGWDSGLIELGVSKTDKSSYNQSNDYSFNPKKIDFAANENICLYKNGILVFGKEPAQPRTSSVNNIKPALTK